MTQKQWVLKQLKAGRALTQRDATIEFGVGRLAARIKELRKHGYPIETKMVHVIKADESVAQVAEYSLDPDHQLNLPL